MIKVDVETNDDGYIKVEVQGHTDPKVCAIVSALMQSNVRTLQELASQLPDNLQVGVVIT